MRHHTVTKNPTNWIYVRHSAIVAAAQAFLFCILLLLFRNVLNRHIALLTPSIFLPIL